MIQKLRVELSLKQVEIKFRLYYSTFKDASFDEFLLASILLNTKDQSDAFDVVREISGTGDLNKFFIQQLGELAKKPKKHLEAIVDNSRFPTTVIDENNRYTYFSDMDFSIFKGKYMVGNIASEKFAMSLLRKEDTYEKYEAIEIREVKKPEIYDVEIVDKKIFINIAGKNVEISEKLFLESVTKENIDVDIYEGKILDNLDDARWLFLTEAKFNNIAKNQKAIFLDEKCITFGQSEITQTRIAKFLGIYFINERTLPATPENREVYDMAFKWAMEWNVVNEMKTKLITNAGRILSFAIKQELINYCLARKDSKDIAEMAMFEIDRKRIVGWSPSALEAIKRSFHEQKDLIKIYKINNEIKYNDLELLSIDKADKTLLSANHKDIVNIHYKNDQAKRELCIKYAGIVTTSGIRERIKGMKNQGSVEFKKLNKSAIKLLHHTDVNIDDLTGARLDSVVNNYEELFELWKHFELLMKNEIPKK